MIPDYITQAVSTVTKRYGCTPRVHPNGTRASTLKEERRSDTTRKAVPNKIGTHFIIENQEDIIRKYGKLD